VDCRYSNVDGLLTQTEGVPPVSIYYPPSSHLSMTSLIPRSLPPDSLAVSRLEAWFGSRTVEEREKGR
jgi:hypothetical protein